MTRGRRSYAPPRPAVRLLELTVANERAREGLLGDLHEEFDSRTHSSSPARARAWYWRSAIGLACRYAWEARRRRGRLETPPNARQGDSLMRSFLQDLRFAVRSMRGSMAVTAVAVLTLAIAIGANTAIFSVLNAVWIAPLPFAEPDRLVLGRTTFDGRPNWTSSGPDFVDYRERATDVFASFACMSGFTTSLTVTGGDAPERLRAQWVSWDFFRTLGIDPIVGRHFREEEGELEADDVAIISHSYWQRTLGGDQNVVGRSLLFDGDPHVVIGVMPAGFRFVYDVEVWRTFRLGAAYAGGRQFHNWTPIGRLADGVTIEQAQSRVDAVAAALQQEYPDTNEGKGMLLVGLHETMVEDSRASLVLLVAVVAALLLIACANVANLLLAKGSGRRAELAVRAALGAGRARLVRQLLTESLVMALLAGALGLVLALWLRQATLRVVPVDMLGITELPMGGRALGFALLASLATTLLFGTLPALRAAPPDLSKRLKGGARSGRDASGGRLRSGLVVVQVGLSVTLLIGSALLLNSFAALLATDPGFDPTDLLTAEIRLPAQQYPAERQLLFFSELQRRAAALPGVAGAALINQLPIRDPGNNVNVYDARRAQADVADTELAYSRIVFPGYFSTMSIPVRAGRAIDRTDTASAPPVMVINETMARKLFPEEDPVGQRVAIRADIPRIYEVVGVVGDVRMEGLGYAADAGMYLSYEQRPQRTMRLALRTAGNGATLAGPLRGIVRELDPNLPVTDIETMEAVIAGSEAVNRSRVTSGALAAFALVALLLAAVGLYGVLAHHVSQRRHEIGVRMALGAEATSVLRLILWRGLLLVGLGLIVGVGGALLATGLVAQQLYGVTPTDPPTYLATVAFFVVVASFSCLVPAWRALRVDPLVALRAE